MARRAYVDCSDLIADIGGAVPAQYFYAYVLEMRKINVNKSSGDIFVRLYF